MISLSLIQRFQSYHSADGGLSLPFLHSFPGLLPAADLLWRQAQQLAHLFSKEAAVAIVNRSVIIQDLQSRHFITLKEKQDSHIFNFPGNS